LAVPSATQTTETTERPGAIRGPGFWRTDLSLFKNMKFTERLTGQLRWKPSTPSTTPIRFAVPRQLRLHVVQHSDLNRDPRIMQLGLKLNF